MTPKVGEKYLITTDEWFYAPDGEAYKAVFGTVYGIYSDIETLGIKTNAKSTNWYLSIGNMTVAGCQIHYAIRTNSVNFSSSMTEIEHSGEILQKETLSRIYNADEAFPGK